MSTIVQDHKENFNTLIRAFSKECVCLLECEEVATGEKVAVICAVSREENGDVVFVPFAKFFNGNPYELLRPPNPDGGFHPFDDAQEGDA